MLRGLGLRAGLVLALALAMASAVTAAEPPRLDAQQMRVLAYRLMAAGDAAQARAMADALLARDAGDNAALMLRAQARAALGDAPGARADARRVWRARQDGTGTDTARFGAAMFMADAWMQAGWPSLGQLWLRKAADVAPDEAARAALAEDYRFMRSRNPLLMRFTLDVAPSSNVNSGATATSFANPGIPWLPPEIEIDREQRALSGAVATFGAALTLRRPPGATTMDALHLRLEQSEVWLSPEAKDIAPDARGSDYSTALAEIGATRRWRPVAGGTVYDLGLFAAHNRAGRAALSNVLRLSLGAERSLGAGVTGSLGLTGEDQHRLDADLRSARVAGLRFGLARQAANGDRWALSLGARDTATESAGLRNHALTARLSWDRAKPLWGMAIGGAISLETRDYPDSPYDPVDGRQDRRLSVELSIQPGQIEYMGFNPVIDLHASRNESDVGLYQSEDYGIGLGFRSRF